MEVLLSLTLIPLAVIVYQDFKFRAISWYLPPLIFMLLGGAILYEEGLQPFWENLFFNSIFILLNLIIVLLYFSLKQKKLINIFQSHLGLGDILFFFSLSPIFAPINFMIFFVICLLIIIVFSILYLFKTKSTNQSIPLAGWMSIQFSIVLIFDIAFPQTFLLKSVPWLF